MNPPKYLYKYKAINSITDLSRILSIINEHKIYMPTYDELNDPLEGAGYNISVPGWAGISIQEAADLELSPIEETKKLFRILSLSSDPVSPQLWAHYSNNYNGICLGFSTARVFKEADKVRYWQKRRRRAFTARDLEEAVRDGFYYKQKEWGYEKEWRIVGRLEREEKFLRFAPNDLVAIIIGNKTPEDIAQIIVNAVDCHVRAYRAVPGYQTASIHLLNWDYAVPLDGTSIEYVTSIEEDLAK